MYEEVEVVYGRDLCEYFINIIFFEKDEVGNFIGLYIVEVEENKVERKYIFVEGSEKYFEVDMVLIVIGFVGIIEDIFINFGVGKIDCYMIDVVKGFYCISEEGVFVCGDVCYG